MTYLSRFVFSNQVLKLTQNMRLQNGNLRLQVDEIREFADW